MNEKKLKYLLLVFFRVFIPNIVNTNTLLKCVCIGKVKISRIWYY